MRNNKGFSLVELLAVIAILGILSGLGIMGYTRYIESSEKKALKIFKDSVISAADNYMFDHPGASSVTIQELIDGDYLEKPDNRLFKDEYRGKVNVNEIGDDSALSKYEYTINMCIGKDYYTYDSASETRIVDKTCLAD